MTLDELRQMIEDMRKTINSLSIDDIIELVSEETAEKLLTVSNYLYDVEKEVETKLRKSG